MSHVHEEKAGMMIAAGELQPFVPFGREHCKRHPSAVNLQLRQLQPAPELWCSDGAAGLVGSLQEVSLQERKRVWTKHNSSVHFITLFWTHLFVFRFCCLFIRISISCVHALNWLQSWKDMVINDKSFISTLFYQTLSKTKLNKPRYVIITLAMKISQKADTANKTPQI